jgi:hypothetical protein
MHKKMLLLAAVVVALSFVLVACAGPEGPQGPEGAQGPAGPQGEAGVAPAAADLTCTECHNDTTLIASKVGQFEENSVHGSGESYIRGEEPTCAGCHGTEGSKARINAGLAPHDESVIGIVNVSPFDCSLCHNKHVTYTSEDWSLTGAEQPTKMEYSDGTFDGGAGNLCASCHQIRNAKPAVEGGNVTVTSSRYGTHYGVESQMLLGEGGLGATGSPSAHYSMVKDTCVACHMGEEFNHTYLPDVARCQACHADAENFDINGAQAKVAGKLEELHSLFVSKGLMNSETSLWIATANAPLVVSEAVANAMWNYKFVTYDQSNGVHNTSYANALLDAALETMNAYTP